MVEVVHGPTGNSNTRALVAAVLLHDVKLQGNRGEDESNQANGNSYFFQNFILNIDLLFVLHLLCYHLVVICHLISVLQVETYKKAVPFQSIHSAQHI